VACSDSEYLILTLILIPAALGRTTRGGSAVQMSALQDIYRLVGS
jgi:hypothetical protein